MFQGLWPFPALWCCRNRWPCLQLVARALPVTAGSWRDLKRWWLRSGRMKQCAGVPWKDTATLYAASSLPDPVASVVAVSDGYTRDVARKHERLWDLPYCGVCGLCLHLRKGICNPRRHRWTGRNSSSNCLIYHFPGLLLVISRIHQLQTQMLTSSCSCYSLRFGRQACKKNQQLRTWPWEKEDRLAGK